MTGLHTFPMLFALIVGHALADYPLQNDFLAQGKNHRSPKPGFDWRIVMANHAVIHGGFVWAITGRLWMGLIETALHFVIDYAKCDGKTDFRFDQFLHVVCKLGYVTAIAWFGL